MTRPAPRDLEPGASNTAMTGACLTVSQVQPDKGCGTIISIAVAGDAAPGVKRHFKVLRLKDLIFYIVSLYS